MKDVLVIQAARLGDLLQTRRLVLTLAAGHRVHLAIDRNLAGLARLIYPFAETHELYLHSSPDQAALARNRAVFAHLRKLDFQFVYNCNFSSLTASICRLFEMRRIRGYRPWRCSDDGIGRSPWARAGFVAGSMRKIATLNLVDFWGLFAPEPVSPLAVNPAAKGGAQGLGVAVAGREQRRSIPVDVLAEVIRIADQLRRPGRIILFGTAADAPQARKLMKLLRPETQARTEDLCGKTDLMQLYQAVAGLDMLITPDTGIMHLAAFAGVPVLAIFLSSALCHETGPYGQGHLILQTDTVCGPCLESAGCAFDLACVKSLRGPGFARTVAQALAGVKPAPQPGLQVWQTGFDELGARPVLIGGVDEHAQRRSYCREIIASFAGLDVAQADTEAYMALLRQFVPESEWMLPRRRYC